MGADASTTVRIIAIVDYDYASSGIYPLRAGTDAIATRLIPGIYDIVYRRGLSSTADPRYVYLTNPTDPFAQGYRILRSGVIITSGANTLNVHVPTGGVTGAITLDGGPIPTTLPGAVAYDTYLYGVSRDTGELHSIAIVDYGYASSGIYPLRAGTDVIDTRLIPGTYDLLYRRGLSSTADPRYVYQTSPADPFAQGYRYLGVCLSVP